MQALSRIVNRRRAPDWLFAAPFAHRGFHNPPTIPENSLAAIGRAIDQGTGIEIDARAIAGGEVVVFHDDDLARMTGVAGAIEERTLAELAPLRLRGCNESIPTLVQALDLVEGRTPLIVEFKASARGLPGLEPLCERLASYHGEFAVLVSSVAELRWLGAHAAAMTRGLFVDCDAEPELRGAGALSSRLAAALASGHPDFIVMNLSDVTTLRAWSLRFVVPLLVETVRESEQWRWAQANASNFMFELSGELILNTAAGDMRPVVDGSWEADSALGRSGSEY